YIPKSASFQEIAGAVRAAAAGSVVLHPSLAGRLARSGGAGDDLSGHEIAILKLLSAGAAYPEVGARLFLSERTVRRHMNVIFAKLGCTSQAQAVAEGMRRGVLD
ncbi:MAG: two-component response regulator, partial [Firmicutes bacterium]|nr:two-component response regulator [Bacillota bacterium]